MGRSAGSMNKPGCRFFTALVLGKAAQLAVKLRGRSGGSSFAGMVAMKICPNFLYEAGKYVRRIVTVTGTNGKTTTAALAAAMMKGGVIHNSSGANMLQGIANMFVLGLPKYFDYAVLETDEGYLTKLYDQIKSDYLIVTNLFDDQVDRWGGADDVAKLIKSAVAKNPDLKLILNADNERAEGISRGQAEPAGASPLTASERAKDITYGFDNPADYKADVEVFDDKSEIFLNGEKFTVPLKGRYNAYNALAAIVLALENGLTADHIRVALDDYKTVSGRGDVRMINGCPATIQLIKNAAGANEVLKTVDLGSRIVIAINNNVSDGRDVSWLGDVEFERLKDSAVIASGMCADAVAERLETAGVKNITTEKSIKKAIEIAAASRDNGKITILPSYMAMMEIK